MTLDKIKNAKELPAAGHYDNTTFDTSSQYSKSFGINQSYYDKMDMPNRNPGVGEYKVIKPFGEEGLKKKFLGVK